MIPKSILHTNRYLGNKHNKYITFFQVVHLCCGYALFVVMIHVPPQITYGEHNKAMAGLQLFPLLQMYDMVMIVLCLCQELPKLDLAHLLLLTEVHGSQVHIDFCDAQKKANTWLGQYLVAETTSKLIRECCLLLWPSTE